MRKLLHNILNNTLILLILLFISIILEYIVMYFSADKYCILLQNGSWVVAGHCTKSFIPHKNSTIYFLIIDDSYIQELNRQFYEFMYNMSLPSLN